jgi:ring-1,2-phenylacetyl-CoA epoxidase subunit PaaD
VVTATVDAWALLREVPDPEVPAVDVVGLGVVRDVQVDGDAVVVTITPTYSGCPAMLVIEESIADALRPHFAQVTVRTVLSPAWTTEWMSDEAREALRGFGIAPPRPLLPLVDARAPETCPHCGSADVERISEFGSTACKALWRCRSCREPFDYFKAH